MESLGDILKRLHQQSISASTVSPENPETEEPADGDPPCPICGGMGWLRRDVPVGHADFGKAVPCQCQIHANETERLARLQRFSNMGLLAGITFDATDPDGRGATAEARTRFHTALQAAQSYAAEPQGWLTLMGASFTGKTHLAAAVANLCMERGTPVLFATAPDLLEHLRSAFSPQAETPYDELFEQVKSVPLLVLDDLGVQHDTPWADEKLFQVLNHRYVTPASRRAELEGVSISPLGPMPERFTLGEP